MSIKQYELPLAEALDPETRLPSIQSTPFRVEEQTIIDRAFEILLDHHRPGRLLTCPEHTKEFLRLKLAEECNEVFGCIFLDNRHRIIAVEDLFSGTIDGASVYPRVIVQRALLTNAAALIAFHNHPSGVAEPSQADIQITTRIKDALALVDVRLLDHFVVAIGETISLAERGLM